MYNIEKFTWRHSFFFIAGLIFVVLVCILYPLKPDPESVGLKLEVDEEEEKKEEEEEKKKELPNEIDDKTTYEALVYLLTSPRGFLKFKI
jgi:sugar phosphate permease